MPLSSIRHLYIHIPFCTHICPYCAFHKERNLLPAMQAFLPALKQEISWAQSTFDLNPTPTTVFFGGGTPSALSLTQLEDLFSAWPFSKTDVHEFTLEANPLTISPDKARVLRQAGVNRISLGVQAFDDEALQLLGRTHRRADIHASMTGLRAAGFTNINIDLMFSLPGQTPEQWETTLREAIALEPDHISTYNLTYEEDTEFLLRFNRGDYQQTEEDNRTMFLSAMEVLESAGYAQYEISNFARPGFESAHNQAIWRGHDYLGLGPSACSTVAGQRWKNAPDTLGYARSLESTGTPPRLMEDLPAAALHSERILLGLRTREGIEVDAILPANQARIPDLVAEGLIEERGARISLTRNGKLVADTVTELLI